MSPIPRLIAFIETISQRGTLTPYFAVHNSVRGLAFNKDLSGQRELFETTSDLFSLVDDSNKFHHLFPQTTVEYALAAASQAQKENSQYKHELLGPFSLAPPDLYMRQDPLQLSYVHSSTIEHIISRGRSRYSTTTLQNVSQALASGNVISFKSYGKPAKPWPGIEEKRLRGFEGSEIPEMTTIALGFSADLAMRNFADKLLSRMREREIKARKSIDIQAMLTPSPSESLDKIAMSIQALISSYQKNQLTPRERHALSPLLNIDISGDSVSIFSAFKKRLTALEKSDSRTSSVVFHSIAEQTPTRFDKELRELKFWIDGSDIFSTKITCGPVRKQVDALCALMRESSLSEELDI